MLPTLENNAAVSEAVSLLQQEPRKRGLMLIADDAQCVQKAVNNLAGRLDMELDVAEDGKEACELAEKSRAEGKPYDVILMDMQMPRMNGIDATKWLRQHDWQGPIIAFSVYFSDENRDLFLAAGCDGFIAKPITEKKLRRAMEQLPKESVRTADAVSAKGKAASEGSHKPTLRGRLLIAEDARCIQLRVCAILRKMNLEPDVADNGQTACEMAMKSLEEGRPYDAILMDVQMPKMNGKQAVRWLRGREWQGAIIAVSIHASEKDHEEFLHAGYDDYVAKPVTESSLQNVLSQFLRSE